MSEQFSLQKTFLLESFTLAPEATAPAFTTLRSSIGQSITPKGTAQSFL
jgi:hypothetical protein